MLGFNEGRGSFSITGECTDKHEVFTGTEKAWHNAAMSSVTLVDPNAFIIVIPSIVLNDCGFDIWGRLQPTLSCIFHRDVSAPILWEKARLGLDAHEPPKEIKEAIREACDLSEFCCADACVFVVREIDGELTASIHSARADETETKESA